MIKSTTLAFALAAGAFATPASAATTAYLKSTGSGVACTAAAPCVNMIQAVAVAGAGGEVICLDKGNYNQSSGFTITQSVTISCGDGYWEAPAVTVTVTTPAGSDVVIEGLVIDGEGTGCCSLLFTGQGSLRLHRVRSGNIIGAISNGLEFKPNGPATLHVSDSIFYNNGGSGILVKPQAGGYANAHIRNTKFERNVHGLFADGSASTIGVNVNIIDSATSENSGNGFGASTTAGQAAVTMSILNSQISGNFANGLGAAGAAASGAGSAAITIGNSMITANGNGLATAGAGQIRTTGSNMLQSNGSNGAFTGNVGLQ